MSSPVLPARLCRLRAQRRPTRLAGRGARVALQFVINYEEGGESCVLHGDARVGDLPLRDRRRAAVPGSAT